MRCPRGRKHLACPWGAAAPRCCPNTQISRVPMQHSPEPASFPLLGLAGAAVSTGFGGAAVERHLAVPALGTEGAVGARRGLWYRALSPPRCCRHAEPPCCDPTRCRDVSPPSWGTPGPRYLVAGGAGAAVGSERVVVAGALVLAGAGEAGVALGLDAQGWGPCGEGSGDAAVSMGRQRGWACVC